MLATANTGKTRERFGKNVGEWTGRIEISKENVPGSKRSIYGYILFLPCQRKRWEDNIREWTGLEFGKFQRAVENREKWRKLVCKIVCGAPTTLAVKGLMMMMMIWLYTDLPQALKAERLSSVFSPDGTLISASAAPHCGI